MSKTIYIVMDWSYHEPMGFDSAWSSLEKAAARARELMEEMVRNNHDFILYENCGVFVVRYALDSGDYDYRNMITVMFEGDE